MSDKSDRKRDRRILLESKAEARDRRLKNVALTLIERFQPMLRAAFPDVPDEKRLGRIIVDYPATRDRAYVRRSEVIWRVRVYCRRPGRPSLFAVTTFAREAVRVVEAFLEDESRNRRSAPWVPGKGQEEPPKGGSDGPAV